MASGATEAVREGAIPSGGRVYYVLTAGAGQTMIMDVQSLRNDVVLGVTDLTRQVPLLRTASGSNSYVGVLPSQGQYQIVLQNTAAVRINYTLQVQIPVRVQFARGAISWIANGLVQPVSSNQYLARANGGQTMTVNLGGKDVILIIYGLNTGNVLISDHAGAITWTGKLPENDDYMIVVRNVGAKAVNYTLEMIIQ
jgi:hypothetical protein